MNKKQLRQLIREEAKKQLSEMRGVSREYQNHIQKIGRPIENMVREMERSGDANKIGEQIAFIVSREIPPEYREDFRRNF